MPNMPHAIRQISKFLKVEKAKTLVNALFGCFVGKLVTLFKIETFIIKHKTLEMIDKNNELIHQILTEIYKSVSSLHVIIVFHPWKVAL